jgi:hypothetical protein
MKINNLNYNLANPVELIHKYQKDQELTGVLEERFHGILTDLAIPRPDHLSELISALYFAICYGGPFKTLGEEYSYLTHYNPNESIFISGRRKLLYFILKTFGVSITKQFLNKPNNPTRIAGPIDHTVKGPCALSPLSTCEGGRSKHA